jgi:transposase
MKKRKSYASGFKTKVVLEVLQERETVQEIGRKYDLHPSQISSW